MAHVKEAYYFSHDFNASDDPKIMAMMNVYGVEGYGRFWLIVEMLGQQSDYRLKRYGWGIDAIAKALLCDANSAEKFVNDCIEKFELFRSDGEFFWSESLIRRMQMKEKKRQQKIEAGRKGAEKRWGDGDAITPPKQDDGTAIAKNGKVKESKGNENKGTRSSEPYSDDSFEMRMAKYMAKRIKETYPGAKPPDLNKWCQTFNRLMRLDGRTPKEIGQVMEWVYQDDFWCTNIRSPDKLRSNWDTLWLQMNRKRKQDKPNNKPIEQWTREEREAEGI